MDDRQFDRWIQALAERLSRRTLGRLGAGVVAALGLDAFTSTGPDSLAKPRKRRKRRADDRKVSRRADKPSSQISAEKKKKGKKKKKASCRPNCSGKTCGSNGCPGGSCGQCIGGEICSDQSSGGVCECPQSAECGSACCTTDETCLSDTCCPTVRECDGACCKADETCINDICEPTSGQPLIACAPCGECWQCEGDSESGAVSCPASCADECHARTLCNETTDFGPARKLARHARDAGYVQVGEPTAVRFTADGEDAAQAVVLYHIHASERTWRAELIYRVDAEGAASAYLALLESNRLTDLLIVDGEGDVVPIQPAGSSPRQRRRRDGATARSLDEPYTLSPMGCSVCQTLLLGSGALALAGSAVAMAGVNFYVAVSWRTAAATATPAPLVLKEQLAFLHVETYFNILDAAAEDPCAVVGNCCFSGERLCPRFNPIDGSTCVPGGNCCNNGVEGQCPGDGDTCFDFRTSTEHCGGCAGGSLGQNCSDALGVHAEFTTCSGGTCDYGNCKERGAPYDPSDTSQNGCCRMNDKGRPCRRVGQEGSDWMCAGYSVPDDDDICCLDDVCPSDPDPDNPRCGCHGQDWGYASSFYTFPIGEVCGNCAACGGRFGYYDTYTGIRTFCWSDDTGELSCQPTIRQVCPRN